MVSHSTNAAVARGETELHGATPVPHAALFQPGRLDVMVHLRALLEVAGDARPITGHTDTNWLAHSDRLAQLDTEPSVVSMGVDADLDRDSLPHVGFGAGGTLSRGSTAAAAALCSGADLYRDDVALATPKRSQADLQSLGFTRDQIRSLCLVWLQFDARSAMAIVSLDHPNADDALHELRCRYGEFHTEVDHLSAADGPALEIETVGSVQLVAVSSVDAAFDSTVERNAAIVVAGRGPDALALATVLFDPHRTHSTSVSHDQRLRRNRRRRAVHQLLDRFLGR